MPSVDANGVSLEVSEWGRGRPIVLVHGSWTDRTTWSLLAPSLRDRFRVVAYDRRGHTTGVGDRGTVHDDVHDLEGLVDALGLDGPLVVGNSFGGTVALRWAARHPRERAAVHEPPLQVAGLAPATDAWQAAERGMREVEASIAVGATQDAARRFIESVAIGPGGWDALPATQRAVLARNAATWLEERRDPDAYAIRGVDLPAGRVLVTSGDRSPLFLREAAAMLAQRLPNGTLRVIAGAGHIPHATHPRATAAAITDWLDASG